MAQGSKGGIIRDNEFRRGQTETKRHQKIIQDKRKLIGGKK